MTLITIILTVFAWRRGWRWLALIPLGVLFLVGLAGAVHESIRIYFALINLVAIGALGIMIWTKNDLRKFRDVISWYGGGLAILVLWSDSGVLKMNWQKIMANIPDIQFGFLEKQQKTEPIESQTNAEPQYFFLRLLTFNRCSL